MRPDEAHMQMGQRPGSYGKACHEMDRGCGQAASDAESMRGRIWVKGRTLTISLRGGVRSLAARLTALLPGRSSPFVTQPQLMDLVRTDRSDIARQVRQTEWMTRHPHRGTCATPDLLMDDWRRFLCWIDGALQHLEQPRPAGELEHLIRTWQHRREKILAPNLRWHRRADVIAV